MSLTMEVKSYEVAQRYASPGIENHGERAFAFLIGRVLSQSDAVKLALETHPSASCVQKSPPASEHEHVQVS